LGRCLVSLEGVPVEGTETARGLSVGDRDALLLHLRRISIGDAMDCQLACPAADCGQRMDFLLSVDDLLLPPPDAPGPSHEVALEVDGGTWTVRFRPPTGVEQEEVAERLASEGAEAAAARLAESCVERVVGPDGGLHEVLPRELLDRLSAAVAEVEPQADLVLRLVCPECGEPFATRLDPAAYFLAELTSDRDRLHRHVHLLAFHYHWSEAEILSLTPRKRRVYLGLLAAELGGESARGVAA